MKRTLGYGAVVAAWMLATPVAAREFEDATEAGAVNNSSLVSPALADTPNCADQSGCGVGTISFDLADSRAVAVGGATQLPAGDGTTMAPDIVPALDLSDDRPAPVVAEPGPGVPLTPSGHVPREYASKRSFFQQAGTIKPEVALLAAYIGVQTVPKLFKETTSFHFKNEGWFGKGTDDIGMDKLTHAFNTYLIAELVHARLHRKTGASEGDALTAGIIAAGLMALNEFSDSIEPTSGYSMQDVAMNVAGATFSVLRNTVPGMKEKVAFKIEIMPNDQIYSRVGKKHYEQQRFFFALKGSGFRQLERSPLRFVDLQVGYYASDFLNSDRAKGITPKRHPFVGVGLNLGELLFAKSQSRVGRAAYSVLDYVQLPYTSVHFKTHGGVSF